MNQQVEQGVVVETIEPDRARVRVPRTSHCEFCQNRQGCCEPFGDNQMVILAENKPKARTGQRVEVNFVSEGSGKAVTVLYIIPLAAMIVGAVIGQNLNPFGRADASAATLGFAFLILSFLGIYGYNRMTWSRDVRLQPRISRILQSQERNQTLGSNPEKGVPGTGCPHCH